MTCIVECVFTIYLYKKIQKTIKTQQNFLTKWKNFFLDNISVYLYLCQVRNNFLKGTCMGENIKFDWFSVPIGIIIGTFCNIKWRKLFWNFIKVETSQFKENFTVEYSRKTKNERSFIISKELFKWKAHSNFTKVLQRSFWKIQKTIQWIIKTFSVGDFKIERWKQETCAQSWGYKTSSPFIWNAETSLFARKLSGYWIIVLVLPFILFIFS